MTLAPAGCTCGLAPPRCDACLAQALYFLRSTAWVRGEDWARSVARRVGTERPWPPYEGRAAELARRKVADIERRDDRIADALARECHAAAAREWARISERR